MRILLCVPLAAVLSGLPLTAQKPAAGSDGRQQTSSHSRTRRVEVVDGRVVVDESTTDGKPDGRPQPQDPGQPALPKLPALPPLPELPKLPELPPMPAAGPGGHASSAHAHTRRVVVENGRTVVDEETVDGKPVRHAVPGGGGAPAPAEARADARADAHAESHGEDHHEAHDDARDHGTKKGGASKDGKAKAHRTAGDSASSGAKARPVPPVPPVLPVPPAPAAGAPKPAAPRLWT